MVSLNSVDTQIINITQEEQLALLQYCNCVNDDMRRMLFSAQGMLILTTQQCAYLRKAIEIEIDRIGNAGAVDILGSLYNKLCTNPMMRKIGEKINGMDFESIEQVQAEADKIMHQHNNAPDHLLGGLNPIQTEKLLYTEWGKPDCPLKLNKNLDSNDVKKVPLYENSLILLKELIQMEKETTATAKGNLARKVVQNLAGKFNFDNDSMTQHLIQTNGRLNEEELTVIWRVRLICQMAGLIKKDKNKFLVTKQGLNLITPENSGRLYNLLFLTFMRKLKIGFSDRLPDIDGLQSTMTYTIYHLGRVARDETQLEEIYRKIVLPAVMKEVDHIDYVVKQMIHPSFVIKNRVIEPLEYAGLLDCTREKVKLFPEIVSLKISPLFQKFIKFEL